MRFAIVSSQRSLPSPGANGSCPACHRPVIAKCGSVRVHHWAHRGERVCDVWWEPRSPWHCAWQDRFPREWQEVIRDAPSGERHIADVHTEHGLTIEFQYSHLPPDERAARERFYGNLVWVVSGARLKGDLPRFLKGMESFTPALRKGLYLTRCPDEVFPRGWINGAVPVFFDFEKACNASQEPQPVTRPLWCLLPGRVFGWSVILRISRDDFVRLAHERARLLPIESIVGSIERIFLAAQRKRQEALARQRSAGSALAWQPFRKAPRFRHRFRRSSRGRA